MKLTRLAIIAILAAILSSAASAEVCEVGNLGYNSYESYLHGGSGVHTYFGPGVGYPTQTGDFFNRYFSSEEWGIVGQGTGHLGQGYGPYIYGEFPDESPPGLYDIPPPAYQNAPPPSIHVRRGKISVSLPNDLPGVRCVTVTLLAYNGAELLTQTISQPPYKFTLPVVDGVANVRVRVDYVGNGLSATSYPL